MAPPRRWSTRSCSLPPRPSSLPVRYWPWTVGWGWSSQFVRGAERLVPPARHCLRSRQVETVMHEELPAVVRNSGKVCGKSYLFKVLDKLSIFNATYRETAIKNATVQSAGRIRPEIFNMVVENYVENQASIRVNATSGVTSTSCTC